MICGGKIFRKQRIDSISWRRLKRDKTYSHGTRWLLQGKSRSRSRSRGAPSSMAIHGCCLLSMQHIFWISSWQSIGAGGGQKTTSRCRYDSMMSDSPRPWPWASCVGSGKEGKKRANFNLSFLLSFFTVYYLLL